MKVVPQAFFEHPAIKIIFRDGLCAAVYKSVSAANEDQERFLAAHALTVVLKGQLRVTDEAQNFAIVGQNEAIFLPKGLYMVSDILPQNKPFEAIVFFFDRALLEQLASQISLIDEPEQVSPLFRMPISKDLRIFIASLLNLYGSPKAGNSAFTRIKLLELLHLLNRGEMGTTFLQHLFAKDKREKKSLQEFMQANCLHPFKIDQFAFLTGRSISTFHRDFKTIFGVAPKKWLIEKRLAKAKKLLANGPIQISEVALHVGYENVPHFIKSFRSQYGITPGQFSIQMRKQKLV